MWQMICIGAVADAAAFCCDALADAAHILGDAVPAISLAEILAVYCAETGTDDFSRWEAEALRCLQARA